MKSEIREIKEEFNKNSILALFRSLNFDDIQRFIEEGEVENEYLECKQAESVHLGRGLKKQLAQTISAFVNNKGGIILVGVETDKAGEVDRLTQIVPIGAVEKLVKEIKAILPLICEPSVEFIVRSIKKEKRDRKGVVGVYVYPTSCDPVRSTIDKKFYLRIGGNDEVMPYETVKRMFVGSNNPDLWQIFDERLVEIQPDGKWKIPIILMNRSNAVGKSVSVSVEFNNPNVCQEITSDVFQDMSDINPGKKILMSDVSKLIYKGLNIVVGNIIISMKKFKLPKRMLDITVTIYAENMRARLQRFKIYLSKQKFRVKSIEKRYLY